MLFFFCSPFLVFSCIFIIFHIVTSLSFFRFFCFFQKLVKFTICNHCCYNFREWKCNKLIRNCNIPNLISGKLYDLRTSKYKLFTNYKLKSPFRSFHFDSVLGFCTNSSNRSMSLREKVAEPRWIGFGWDSCGFHPMKLNTWNVAGTEWSSFDPYISR